ncbi:MAG TPA: YciI family protein [Steroidobacteraceae bacterium]|nr:YciI family protein [Steroidobacteraceae bacterium]
MTPNHVAVYCIDAPGSLAGRKTASPAHLRYIETILDRLLLAGPMFSDDGGTVVGSLYVFKTASLEEARHLIEADPYFQAKFWVQVDFRLVWVAAGECVGGKLW